jgi:hypothetical protein
MVPCNYSDAMVKDLPSSECRALFDAMVDVAADLCFSGGKPSTYFLNTLARYLFMFPPFRQQAINNQHLSRYLAQSTHATPTPHATNRKPSTTPTTNKTHLP